MQFNKIKILIMILVLVLSLSFTSTVYADTTDGWKGYSLYNINDSKVTIINEDVNIELLKGRLAFTGEYLIRNNSSTTTKATVGIPAQGIDKITLIEKNTSIKWRKRSLASMQNEFGMETRIPKEEFWYVFNITLSPGETKLFNLNLEAVQQKEDKGSFTFTYYNDRKLGFSNQMEKTSLYIGVADFEPYNVLSVQGFEPGLMGVKGDIVLKAAGEKVDTVAIEYMDVTKALMDRLHASAMYKLREIALVYSGKNYIKAAALCDEFLKNSIDAGISVEEIKFIKAESLRRLQNYDEYLKIVDNIDYSKLNPLELKNKILMDKMTIYTEMQNHDKLKSLLNELEQEPSESAQILKAWIKNSNIYGSSQLNNENQEDVIIKEDDVSVLNNTKLEQIYKKALDYKYTPIILFATGLLLGLILSLFRFKRKRKKSNYIYRM